MTQENTENPNSTPVTDSAEATKVATVSGATPAPGAEDAQKREVSAATVARLMGVATATDLKLLDGKLDLLSGRLHNIGMRVEKLLTVLGNMPTGSDLERIDVQVASLRSLIKDILLREMTSTDIRQAFEKQVADPVKKSKDTETAKDD